MRIVVHRQRAFSLVELLAAIGILAVLAAMLFPVARNLTDRAASTNCAANMRSLGATLLTYRADHDGYFPTGIEGKRLLDPTSDANPNPQSGASVTKPLREGGYLKGNTPLCPAMRLSAKGQTILKPGESAKGRLNTIGSYNLNVFLVQVKPVTLSGRYWWGTNPYPGDSRMVFLAESHAGIGGSYDGLIWADSQCTTALNGVDYGTSINVRGRDHGNHRLNFMFLDGHIAPLAPKVTADGAKVWNATTATLKDPEIPFDSWGRNGKYIGVGLLRATEP